MTAKTTARVKQVTHLEVTNQYLNRNATSIMYSRGSWHSYNNGVWDELHKVQFEGTVLQLLEAYENKKRIRATSPTLSSVIRFLKTKLFVPDEKVDAAPNLVNLQNGVYNLETGKMIPHDPGFYLTSQLPFAYDENAVAPIWQMYLSSTFVKPKTKEADPDLIKFIQEAMGYSLTTSVKYHVSFWCPGEGNNGKGVLFHVLEQLAGPSAISLNIGLLKREQYQLAMLAGKTIAMCSESGATQNLVEDAIIKALVAGDTMNVRMIKKEPFMLQPVCKLWWSMNSLPAVADSSHGFWRRVRVVPFNRIFDEKEMIPDLKEMLAQELPGIFNWVMAGLGNLKNQKKFTVPQQSKEARQEFKTESNPVEMFVQDECEVDAKEEIQASHLYDLYKTWCFTNGFKQVSSRKFKREIVRLGFQHDKTRLYNVYIGLHKHPAKMP